MKRKTQKQTSAAGILVSQLQVRSADRSHKDISSWRRAHRAAESVSYPSRVALYDIYDDILLDGHLTGIIGKRIDAVLNKQVRFEKQGVKHDAFDRLIDSPAFRMVLTTIMETRFWGISGLEFPPGRELQPVLVPRRHICPHLGIISWQPGGLEGERFADWPGVWIMGGPADLGLLLKCAPYALYKRGNWGDWSQYVELFGMPVRVLTYDAYDTQTRLELDRILSESGSALAIKVPKQAGFQMFDGKQSNGDGRLQDTFREALNAELSVLVLGNTETTTNGRTGTGAKSGVHLQQQVEVTKSDLVYVRNMLNTPQFLAILAGFGYPVQGGRFVFADEADIRQVKEKLDLVGELGKMGLPVDADYVYDLTGLPRPATQISQQAGTAPGTGTQPLRRLGDWLASFLSS